MAIFSFQGSVVCSWQTDEKISFHLLAHLEVKNRSPFLNFFNFFSKIFNIAGKQKNTLSLTCSLRSQKPKPLFEFFLIFFQNLFKTFYCFVQAVFCRTNRTPLNLCNLLICHVIKVMQDQSPFLFLWQLFHSLM